MQACGGRDHDGIAAKRDGVQSVQNDGDDDLHDDEEAEQGHELADQRDQRTPARRAQPRALAPARELRADGVARRQRHDDVQHGRQDRAQQELRVVQSRVRENVLLGNKGARPVAAAVPSPRQRGRGRGDRIRDRGIGVVAGGEILPVVERHDLGAMAGQEIAFEILRDVDGGDRLAGADRPHRARHVPRTLGDADAGGRADRLDVGERRRRAIGVDDRDPEIADDRVAEGQGQDGEGDHRNDDRQDERDLVAPHPAQLPRGDAQQSRPRRPLHRRSPDGHSA